MTPLVGISQSVWEFHEMRRDAVLQMFAPLRMLQPPFLKHIPPKHFGMTQLLGIHQGRVTPADGQLMSTSQQHTSSSNALWDFGSYPERGGGGLLFEKEVLAIQVRRRSKLLPAKENTFTIQFQAEEESKESDADSCRVISWTAFMCCAGIIPWMFL